MRVVDIFSVLLLICSLPNVCPGTPRRFVKRFARLSYDTTTATRRKREANGNSGEETAREITFDSHDRHFHLSLLPAGFTVFPPSHSGDSNSMVDENDRRTFESINVDAFLYEGKLVDDPGSYVYGSLIDGVFDGHIYTSDGKLFHVEKAIKYYSSAPKNFHSLIYEDADIDYDRFNRQRRSLKPEEPRPMSQTEEPTTKENNDRSEAVAGRTCGLYGDTATWMQHVEHNGESGTPGDHIHHTNEQIHHHVDDHDGETETVLDRYRRQLNNDGTSGKKLLRAESVNGHMLFPVRTCSLYMQADHKLYEQIFKHEGQRQDQRTREEILSLFYSHVKTLNRIYESTSFGGVAGVNFIVQRTTIYNPSSCNQNGTTIRGAVNPFCADNVDVSNYLNLNSMSNHSAFCLAFSLTYRDFVGGTLGLAWVASPQPNTAGGICQIFQRYNERRGWVWRSLNTGIITLVNYGHRVPARVSQLTLAHEIGHNFGSPHDYPSYCQPGLPDGNYIMYASATSGDKPNNEEFSDCSKNNISAVLYAILAERPIDPQKVLHSPSGGKRNCFSARTSAFCGNNLVEPGEECDCGFTAEDCKRMGDSCCHPHKTDVPGAIGCTRIKPAKCSPSEGFCCESRTCGFSLPLHSCREKGECTHAQTCNGYSAQCPASPPKTDGTLCQENTKICRAGQCNTSICELVGLKECFIKNGSPEEKCRLACVKNGQCTSSFNLPELAQYYQRIRNFEGKLTNIQGILKRPGSPCDEYRGYCDIFRKCRSVDSTGPLSRLRNFFLNREVYETLEDWVKDNWWAVLLMLLGVILFMALFIKCCAVHTPSTNPNKPPAYNFYETLRHPSTLIRPERARRRRPVATTRDSSAAAATAAANGRDPPARSAARNRADRHRHRHRRPNESNAASSPSAPTSSAAPMPLVPPSEPPPPYLAVVSSSDVVVSVPPGGPKRGHRKHRQRETPPSAATSSSNVPKRT